MIQQFKKHFIVLTCIITISMIGFSQGANQKIVKVRYTSTPISQHTITEREMDATPTKASEYEYLNGITDYYSLYINLKDRSSVFVLDSTEQVRPKGWEDDNLSLADTVFFALKTPKNKTLKHEWIMNQIFFTEGEVGNIEWELSDETKTINGLKSFKAKATNYPMLTVWYTKDVPVSNGPSIYQGLPGLVVWAEDFFRTIQILDIEYSDNIQYFNDIYKLKHKAFEEQVQGEHFSKEPIVLIKKGNLARALYEYQHSESNK